METMALVLCDIANFKLSKLHTHARTRAFTHKRLAKLRKSGHSKPLTSIKIGHNYTAIHTYWHTKRVSCAEMISNSKKDTKTQPRTHIHKAPAEIDEIAVPRSRGIPSHQLQMKWADPLTFCPYGRHNDADWKSCPQISHGFALKKFYHCPVCR